MQIDQNKLVSLIYELREKDSRGRIIEKLEEDRPLKFIFGTGKLLPSFEENLYSLGIGDNFNFNLRADQAYGERREELVIDVPMSVFEVNGKVDENICRIGNEVPMMDTSGNKISGIIYEITENSVRMDFNHPMASVDLFFSGKIIDVSEPTQEELNSLNTSCTDCNDHCNSGCEGSCN